MSDDRSLFRGALRFLLLERIAAGEAYGYQLVVDLRALELFHATESTVYPTLARLEKDGLLAARLEASGRGAARKYYRLTAAGKDARSSARQAWQVLAQAVERLQHGAAGHQKSEQGRTDAPA